MSSDHGVVVDKLGFDAPVPRWVRVRDEVEGGDPPFDLDDDGFLPAPDSHVARSVSQRLIRPEEAVDSGALVLLGEPGAGKTTTLSLVTGASPFTLPPDPGQPGTVWVTGSELSDLAAFRQTVGEHLDALPSRGPGSAPHRLTIVLDQLDESPFLQNVPRRLWLETKDKDTRSLRLLIACRTADYPESLTAVLDQALGGCVVADLAPLTRADVATLAGDFDGVDPQAFVEAVVANGAGTLASVPLTLRVLLGAYEKDARSLNQGPLALFATGVKLLADEHDRDRARSRAPVASVPQRVQIAGRIAARLVLSGQRAIWTGEYALADAHDLTEGALAGGTEIAGGVFDVTPAAVAQTLETALFSRNGPRRRAFAHSSFAAYLAAQHLVNRGDQGGDAALRQLAGLFLVAAPDEDSASIPIHLRETAAWLLAHAPTQHRWLARADPQGLMAHSAVITDPDTRAMMTDELLRRASEVELSQWSWRRTRWRLGHPGLADQLRVVLDTPNIDPAVEWDYAKTTVALHLARDCVDESVTDVLLRLVENPELPTLLRTTAADVAMETAAAVAAPRLRALLNALQAVSDDRGQEHDELVGVLLSLLWPGHLELPDVLPHVRPVQQRPQGVYRWQLNQFPRAVADADVPLLLDTAGRLARKVAGLSGDGDLVDVTGAPNHRLSRETTLEEVLAPITDRVSISPDVHLHVPALADLFIDLIRVEFRPTLPVGFDLLHDDGSEMVSSRELRHALAETMVLRIQERTGAFDLPLAFMIAYEWTRTPSYRDTVVPAGSQRGDRTHLLDDHDFAWALDRAQHHHAQGGAAHAAALRVLATAIADLYNPATFERAYTLRHTPEWTHIKWMYEGIEPDSRRAKNMKRSVRGPKEWQHATEFAQIQRERLRAAAAGDTTAFPHLVHALRANPTTGQPDLSDTHDVRRHHGVSLWPEHEFDDAFHLAARHYLLTENDDRDIWLGARPATRKSEAGYAALVFLHNTGRLHDLDVPWSAWVGAVIDKAHRLDVAKEGTVHNDLLNWIAVRAPADLDSALQQLVRRASNNGRRPWALSQLTSALPSTTYPLFVTLAEELHAALTRQTIDPDTTHQPDDGPPLPQSAVDQIDLIALPPTQQARDAALQTWQDILRQPLITGDARANQLATQALDTQDGENTNLIAVAAGRVLLFTQPATAWPIIHSKLTSSPQFAQDLAWACADRSVSDSITETLSDTELAQVYLWLTDTCPPDTEATLTDGYVTGEQLVHEWRTRTLTLLSRRGTVESVRSVRGLVDRFPDDRTLQSALINARRQAQAADAVLLTHEQVTTLLADPHRRVVRTAVELAEVLVDTITDIQDNLHTHSNLLWDCERLSELDTSTGKTKQHRLWRPKREGALSAYIAHELLLRLQVRGIIVNREVMIKPTDEGDSGERPDILVEATATSSWHESIGTISVPIEIKGNWHEAVPTAQRDQLMRYLAAKNTDAGVYLVGWYDLEHWTADDPNPKRAATRLNSPERLAEMLEEQAVQIRVVTGRRTFPAILSIRRAAPSGRSELSE